MKTIQSFMHFTLQHITLDVSHTSYITHYNTSLPPIVLITIGGIIDYTPLLSYVLAGVLTTCPPCIPFLTNTVLYTGHVD